MLYLTVGRVNKCYLLYKSTGIHKLLSLNHFVFHLPKKGAGADPIKSAPPQILNLLRLRNTAVEYLVGIYLFFLLFWLILAAV